MKKDFKHLYYDMLDNINIDKHDPEEGMKTSPGFITKLNEYLNTIEKDEPIDTVLMARMLYEVQPQCLMDIYFVGLYFGLKIEEKNDEKINTIEKAMTAMIEKHMSTIDNMSLEDSQLTMLAFNAFKLSAKLWIEHRNACDTQEDVFKQDCEFAKFIENSVL